MNAPTPRRPVKATAASIIALAAPLMLAHLTEPLIGLVDTAVIGRLGEVHLLGAVAVGAVLFDMLFWGLGSLRMSTAGLTAQAHGAGDDREIQRVLARALAMAAMLGVALIGLQTPIMAGTFAFMEASSAVTAAARDYIAIRIWSGPFALSNYAILGSLIGRGRTDLGLLLQVGLNLAKVIATVLFVAGLGWGVQGAALATLLAEALGVAGGVWVLSRAGGLPRGLSREEVLNGPAIVRMLAVNRDVAIRTVALLSAFAFFTAQGARAGDVTLAANAVLYNLFLFGSYFLDGFATAAEQRCGQALGARDERGFRATVRLTLWLSLGVGALVWLAALFGGDAFIEAISTSEPVREAARAFLPYAALTPLLGAAAFTFDGVYVGATWTVAMRNLMLAALAIYLGVFYGAQALFGAWSNAGLWIAFMTFLAVRGLGQMLLYPRLARRSFAPA